LAIPRDPSLFKLRTKIANNEIRGGSAFGRAVAEVIALTADAHADADPANVRAAVLEAARWGVQTKPSMTSVRAVARLAEETLERQEETSGGELARTVACEMRVFIARSKRAIASLAESGAEIFRPGAIVLVHSFSESLVTVLRRAATKVPGLILLLTESRPLKESHHLAKALADTPAKITLYSDAALAIAAAKLARSLRPRTTRPRGRSCPQAPHPARSVASFSATSASTRAWVSGRFANSPGVATLVRPPRPAAPEASLPPM